MGFWGLEHLLSLQVIQSICECEYNTLLDCHNFSYSISWMCSFTAKKNLSLVNGISLAKV